jgi:hypothetical protein
MIWRGCWIVLAWMSISCVEQPRSVANRSENSIEHIHANAKAELERIRIEWDREASQTSESTMRSLVYPTCSANNPAGSTCGLVSTSYMSRAFAKRFAKEHCQRSHGTGCLQLYMAAFNRDIVMRYGVDPRETIPKDDSFGEIEIAVLEVHNDRVFELRRRKMSELNAKYTAMADEVVERFAAALNRMRVEDEESRRVWEAERRVVLSLAMGLKAMGDGLAGQSRRSQVLRCTSDYDCIHGTICLKARGSFDGQCVEAVDGNGLRTYQPPRPASVHAGNGTCAMTGCPIGFRCEEGNCVK